VHQLVRLLQGQEGPVTCRLADYLVLVDPFPVGFRFRRSIKLLPGVRVNLGAKSASVSLGRRGASVNIGKRGVRANVGIPGTGMSWSERIDGGGRANSSVRQGPARPGTSQDARRFMGLVLGLGACALLVAFGASPALAGALSIVCLVTWLLVQRAARGRVEELHLANEEQRAANEELRLAVEEDRAANEELRLALEGQRAAEEELRLAKEEQRAADEELRLAVEEQHAAEEELRLALEEHRAAEGELGLLGGRPGPVVSPPRRH